MFAPLLALWLLGGVPFFPCQPWEWTELPVPFFLETTPAAAKVEAVVADSDWAGQGDVPRE